MDVTAAISGQWKIITGENTGIQLSSAHLPLCTHVLFLGGCWMSPTYPNGSSDPSCNTTIRCAEGCLFNIFDDPGEYNDLAQAQPEKLQEMIQLLAQLNQTFFDPVRSGGDPKAAGKVRVVLVGNKCTSQRVDRWLLTSMVATGDRSCRSCCGMACDNRNNLHQAS
jgi:hypothetical protein